MTKSRRKRLVPRSLRTAASAIHALTVVPHALAVTARDLGIPEPVSSKNPPAQERRASPGIAFDSPVGFGLTLGEIGVAVGGTKISDKSAQQQGFGSTDGSASVLVGLGNPATFVGLDLVVDITSLQNSFGDAGGVGFKVHRRLFDRGSLALGIEDAARWGGSSDADSRYYAAYTHAIPLRPSNAANDMPIVLNAGYGRVRHFEDTQFNKGAAFGSIAFIPVPWASLIFDWTGSYLSAGVSVMPFPSLPFAITLGVSDVGDRYPIYGRRFSGAIGYLFSL